MDYQTKIIIEADKALRDMQKLEKVFNANDEVVSKYNEELKKLTNQQRLLTNQTKRLADEEMKSASALNVRIKKRKELSKEYIRINTLIGNEIKNIKHANAMNKTASVAVDRLAIAYKKYGIRLNATGIFMKKLSGNTSLFIQKQNALNAQSMKTNKLLNANTVAIKRYGIASKNAASSNILLGNSVGFVNKFLKIQLVMFRTAMLAATAYMGVRLYIELNKTAESLDLLGRKLEVFTNDSKSLDLLTASAIKTGFALQDMGKIITRFAVTTEGQFDTKTLVKWTEGLVISARAVGTTTMELNNALIQLSQSFSAGFLMGDEYRSISENLPLFKLALRDVADEAGFAGTSLKELSSGRKIDIDLMTKALKKLSDESEKYVFALDNIEAAEGRVKVGWELFLNSVADSSALKDALNFISGVLIELSGDQKAIASFRDNFSELSVSIQGTVKEFKEFISIMSVVGSAFATLFGVLFDFISLLNEYRFIIAFFAGGAIMFKVVKGVVALGVAMTTTTVATGVLTTALGYLIAFATPLGLLAGAAIALTAALSALGVGLSSWISESISAREEFEELNRTIFESEEKMKSFIETANNLDLSGIEIDVLDKTLINLKNSTNLLAEELKLLEAEKKRIIERFKEEIVNTSALGYEISLLDEKMFNIRLTIMRAGTSIKAYSDQSELLKEKLDSVTKSLKNFVSSIGLAKAPKSFTTYIDGIKDLEKEIGNAKRANMSSIEIEKFRTEGVSKLVKQLHEMEKVEKYKSSRKGSRLTDAQKDELAYQKEVTKVYEEGKKALIKYYKIKEDINQESINSNEFQVGPDLLDDIKKYNKAIELLGKNFALTGVDAKDYKEELKELEEIQKALIDNKTREFFDELARSYDEVESAAYDLAETEHDLILLRERGTISVYAYNKALFESERALNLALAKSKEMNSQDQVFEGLKDGLWDFANNTKTIFEEISELTTRSFNGMTDELAKFVRTGKLDFNSLVDSILDDLARIAVQQAITKPLAGALTNILGGILGGGVSPAISFASASTGGLGVDPGLFSGFSTSTTFANGGAFKNGVQKFANGTVVNSPTIFPMANGAGLMAEEGPEAIMPLMRDSSGKLGVKGSGSSNKTIVNINNYGNNEVSTKESTNSQGIKTIDVIIEEKVNAAIKSGGLDKSMNSSFGINRRGY